jgi:fructokinase
MFLVCGEALYDVFTTKADDKGSFAFEARIGGSPFNVAVGLARLENPVALLTGISHDMLGEGLTAALTREGVKTQYLVRNERRTTLSLVGLDKTGSPHYTFYGVGSADCSLTKEDMPVLSPHITALHFGSYSHVVSPTADAFYSLACQEKHRFISLDPNIRLTIEPDKAIWMAWLEKYLTLATLIKVSEEDLMQLYPHVALETLAQGFLGKGVKLVVITRGAKGALVFTNTQSLTLASLPVAVVDTVGAGDSFQASLLASLAAQDFNVELNLHAIVMRANRAASLTCQKRGADLPRLLALG